MPRLVDYTTPNSLPEGPALQGLLQAEEECALQHQLGIGSKQSTVLQRGLENTHPSALLASY